LRTEERTMEICIRKIFVLLYYFERNDRPLYVQLGEKWERAGIGSVSVLWNGRFLSFGSKLFDVLCLNIDVDASDQVR
jgi:hypothetical protein